MVSALRLCSAGTPVFLIEAFRGFPQAIEANAGMLSQFDHVDLFPVHDSTTRRHTA
jgi:hypothetical protein